MNETFYALPEEKQQRILNAGFRVFAQNSYKKSPMQEVAGYAGISKSLLFYYFRNKKELYLFLWEKACDITTAYLTEYGCYEPTDLFEMMERGMQAKLHMMRKFQRDGCLDVDKLEADFCKLLSFWKKIYLRKGK